MATGVRTPIASMPGQFRLSPDTAAAEAKELWNLGVLSVILFGIPDSKDEIGSGAYDANGPVPITIKAIKNAVPEMVVIADTCACEYTSHGHCGILQNGIVANDPTLEILSKARYVLCTSWRRYYRAVGYDGWPRWCDSARVG